MIYLLDLNFTLVTNSDEKRSPFSKQIEHEEYDTELLDMLKGEMVILVTARPAKYKQETLDNIEKKTGVKIKDAYFNTFFLPPPQLKTKIMTDLIFPKYGNTPFDFFGIESNPKTRYTYKQLGINSASKEEFKQQHEKR